MQAEHPHTADASALPTPSSPTLPTYHRHHPHRPTADAIELDPLPTLRRRITLPPAQPPQPSSDDTIRINIATPFADSGGSRNKDGFAVPRSMRCAELKDELAHGRLGDSAELWDREGMRVVWQGRIVRDEEQLGEVVKDSRALAQAHTFHLVARRIAPASRPAPSAPQSYRSVAEPSTSAAEARPSFVSTSNTSSTVTIFALADSVHYLLFTARHHLCHLISRPPLAWDGTTPPPVVEQSTARQAVMSVVQMFAESRGEGIQGWQTAFEVDLEAVWTKLGRISIEQEIRNLWVAIVGRVWDEGEEGEKVMVEMDNLPYQLHLPPLRLSSPSQLVHLLQYLRITSLLPSLNDELELQTLMSLVPLPPPTRTIPALPQPVLRQSWTPTVTAATALALALSAAKLAALVFMVCRGMDQNDGRLWIILGGAMGWWLTDAWQRLALDRRRAAARAPAIIGAGAVAAAAAGPAPGAAAPAANVAVQGQRPPHHPSSSPAFWSWIIPLMHLDRDLVVLRLPGRTHPQMGDLDAGLAANPALLDRMRRAPPLLLTHVFLPIYLWLVTLFPAFEAVRGRAIRRRERAMRAVVSELSAGHVDEMGEPMVVLPDGLEGWGKAYYERVIAKGEGIDWEEEREAQRAMGIGEEEEMRGEGGLGLL